jgi:hypothetical protein
MSTSTDRLRRSLDAWWGQSERAHAGGDPGVEANRRLTAVVGALQIGVLTLVGLSGVVFGWSPGLHFFLGFAAIPLTLVKLATTGWRFLSYYLLRSPPYRAAGPPAPLPRLLGPVVVVSAMVAFVSGVVLFFLGADRGRLATVHTYSAVLFGLAVTLHAAIHLRTAYQVSLDDLRPRLGSAVLGTASRRAVVLAASVVGVVVAVALVGGYHWAVPLRHIGDRALGPR